jgi:hypothetical protein
MVNLGLRHLEKLWIGTMVCVVQFALCDGHQEQISGVKIRE